MFDILCKYTIIQRTYCIKQHYIKGHYVYLWEKEKMGRWEERRGDWARGRLGDEEKRRKREE